MPLLRQKYVSPPHPYFDTFLKKKSHGQPDYKKVLYRTAKALAGLSKYQDAVDFCDKVLEVESENVYAIRLREDCEKHIKKVEKLNDEIAPKVE